MRIKITKNLVLGVQDSSIENDSGEPFPAGEYLANLTPEGKIEVINTKRIKALFSFSQFREKISLGEFIVIEA
jgi:hypothetical protein